MAEAALGVGGLEEVLVTDLDAHEAVREVRVGHGPVLESPSLVGEDDLDHEHVGDGVADGLVDEITNGGERLEGVLLCGRLRLLRPEDAHRLLGEDDGAVAVGLEVDANVELARGVVQMLDTRGRADNGELQVLLDVVGAGTVGVSSLDNTNTEVVLQTSGVDEVANEGGGERRNAIAVQHEESSVRIDPVVNETVSIAIERAASHTKDGLRVLGSSLLGLDKVGTALQVEDLGSEDIVVDNLDVETCGELGDHLEHLRKLGPTHTICAVYRKLTLDLLASQRPHERVRELLVVASLAGLAVRLGGAFGVDATGQVVQLRRRQDLVVGVLGVGGTQGGGQRNNEAVARGTSITAVDDAARGVDVDLELGGQRLVRLEEVLVGGAVDEAGGVGLPLLLEHLAHGVDDLDAVVRGRVVAGGDHDPDGLAVELAAAQAGEEADAERDAGQQVCLHAEARRAVLVDLAGDDGVFGRGREDLFVHDGRWR
ncbi:hypothetical protein TOPH_05174 [Tolypocladium ophioglossoides CBS 100239]|uniref:Uncharacterized protein n=1 Tax=Tolypocladium ophioglossoides (strain CBS 100239) TaxID=1163406 RepID=A0A0L0N838_TOLOC|nr:hypothetical protein TOPH_05174 [Tolypocladium ophioglossoides CBS 100239]